MEARSDVVIVGFGPVGAMTALFLAQAGHGVQILEASPDPVVLPRAVGMDGESMRAFQRLGLDAEVDAILQPRRATEQYAFTDSTRRVLIGLDMPECGPNGWRDNAFFDQPELEELLRTRASEHPRVEVCLGQEVCGFEASGDGVEVRSRGEAGERIDHGAYLVGCDGASSFVRRSLGLEWVSLGYDQDWLVIDVTIEDLSDLPLDVMQVCDPIRLTTYIPGRDPNRRWEFQLLPGETREQLLDPDTIDVLLAPWIGADRYSLRRKAVYQFHAATAATMQVGRVLLAGDSAHQTPPFLGQGLNSGFRDAASLGWRLPRILSGLCGEELLTEYTTERLQHSRDLVDRAVGVGQLMETLAAREAGLPDPHGDAAGRAAPSGDGLVPPLCAGLLLEEQLGEGSPVGRLIRQPTVSKEGAGALRFDSLLGNGFALVGRTQSDLELGPAGAELAVRLGVRRVSVEGLEVVEGEADRLFEDHPAVLVRPDRYIYGAVDEKVDADALLSSLAERIALR